MASKPIRAGSTLPLILPEWHQGQQRVWAERKQRNYVCAHRGWWKSSMAVVIAMEHLMTGQDMGWYAQVSKPINDAQNIIKKCWGGDDSYFNKTDNFFKFPGGGTCYFYSLDEPDNARGPSYPLLIVDEAGTLARGTRDSVLYPILRKSKGILWEFGTPNPNDPFNEFYSRLKRAMQKGGSLAGWMIPANAKLDVDMTTLLPDYNPYANDYYTFDELAEDYDNSERPKLWTIEWLCRFVADDGSQFEDPEAVCVLPPIPTPPISSGWYQGGVDVAKDGDYTVISVLDRNTNSQVFMRRFTNCTWASIYKNIYECACMYPGQWVVDITGAGSQIPEEMLKFGLAIEGVKFNNTNKQDIYNHLAALISHKKIKLWNDPDILNELNIFQRALTPSGRATMKAPGDKHDDIVTSLALMVKDYKPALLDVVVNLEAFKMAESEFSSMTLNTW